MFIYDGSGRSNATTFIEGNSTATKGAPFRAPISSKLIVVAATIPNSSGASGTLTFSYELHDSAAYPWFYEPYLGQESWYWTLTLIGVALFPLLVCLVCSLSCKYCKCCRKCCPCCFNPNAVKWETGEKGKVNQVSSIPGVKDPKDLQKRIEAELASLPRDSEGELKSMSEFGENEMVSDGETIPVPVYQDAENTYIHTPRSGHHKRHSLSKQYDSVGQHIGIDSGIGQDGRNNINALNVSDRPNCKFRIHFR